MPGHTDRPPRSPALRVCSQAPDLEPVGPALAPVGPAQYPRSFHLPLYTVHLYLALTHLLPQMCSPGGCILRGPGTAPRPDCGESREARSSSTESASQRPVHVLPFTSSKCTSCPHLDERRPKLLGPLRMEAALLFSHQPFFLKRTWKSYRPKSLSPQHLF